MKINKSYLFSIIISSLLALYTVILQNYEFLIYAVTILVLITILYKTDQYFNYRRSAIWLFNVWIMLHMLGGLGSYNGVRIYDLVLVDLFGAPYHVLKYDQFVHFYCYFVVSLLMWSVVQAIAKKNASMVVICVVTILAASSLGAINEIIEFSAVVILDADGVGGYTNTVIDLIANLLGATIGVIYVLLGEKLD